jgi:mRNA interferase MazF
MKRGKVVLVPFPFTDLSSYKVRPALVVSRSDRRGASVVVAFIGSYTGKILQLTDLLVEEAHPDFSQTGLKVSSIIKLDQVTTLDGSLLLGEIGEMSDDLMQDSNEKLRHALDL